MSARPGTPDDPRSSFAGRIGVDRCDITPPPGIYARNWGAATRDTAEGVHRPLTATAVTFQSDNGSQPAALVSLDLGWWRSFRDEHYVRDYVQQQLDLDPARLMISLSHTHAGPVLCREDRGKPGGELIQPYLDMLRESIVSTISRALSRSQHATLSWSYGTCGLACNRDLPDPDSRRILCGYNPAGPADTTLLVGRIDAGSSCTAVIVNYACHPTTLAWENRLISPDFVGAAREVVESSYPGATCVFLQGASGELAPRRQYTADTSVADANGRMLGYAVLSTLEGMPPHAAKLEYNRAVESGATLAVWSDSGQQPLGHVGCRRIEVDLPLSRLPALPELDAEILACNDRVMLERLTRKRRIREAVGDGNTTKMPAWIWKLGDSMMVGHPNEAYSLLQSELRRRFPDRTIAVMNVVNGHFGYLPPVDLYGNDIYPVWQTPFGKGSLERLIEECATQSAG